MTAAWLFVVGTGLALALPLAVRMFQRRFDIFEPFTVFVVAYAVVFVGRPAWMLAHRQFVYFGLDIRSTLPLALLLGLVGCVAFVCGYELGAGQAVARALPAPRELTPRAGILGASCLVCAALAALVFIAWRAGGAARLTVLFQGRTAKVESVIDSAGSYPSLAAMLVIPAALALLGVGVRYRRRKLFIPAAVVFAVALYLTVPLGARAYLLPLVGGAVTFLYLHHGKRPRLPTVVVVACVAVVASYALTLVRSPDFRPELGARLRELAQRPDIAFSSTLHGMDSEMVPVLSAALTVIPDRLHYRYGGAVFGDLFTRPIPRQVWSDKPRPVEKQLVGAIWPNVVDTYSPAFTPNLFFYWDFGLAGVVVGMAVFGFACRTLWEWFLRHSSNVSAQLIFGSALWLIVGAVRNDPVSTIVYACFFVLPLVLLQRLSAAPARLVDARFGQARPLER